MHQLRIARSATMLRRFWFLPLGATCLVVLTLAGCGRGPGSVTGGGGGNVTDNSQTRAQADFVASATMGDAPFAVTFTDRSVNATSLSWDFGDGTTSTATNPTHVFTSLGRRTVTLTARGADGTTSVVTLPITTCLVIRPFLNLPAQGAFFPVHTNGDCEFGGHGPETWLDARLGTDTSGKKLILTIHMKARETQSDWTTAESTWEDVVWTSGSSYTVRDLSTVTTASVHVITTTKGYHDSAANDLGRFHWVGDTDGNDVCGTTQDDTHTYFILNPNYQVRIQPS